LFLGIKLLQGSSIANTKILDRSRGDVDRAVFLPGLTRFGNKLQANIQSEGKVDREELLDLGYSKLLPGAEPSLGPLLLAHLVSTF